MILSVCAQKGGCGKTTLAVCLAGEAVRIGYKTLLIDADPQGSAMHWFQQGSEETQADWPDILSAPTPQLGQDLRAEVSEHDVIVIDCPPQHHEITKAAIALSHIAVVPISPSTLDLLAMKDHTVSIFREVSQRRPDLKGLLAVSRKQPNTLIGRHLREVLSEGDWTHFDLLESEVSQRTIFAKLPTYGQLIHQAEPNGDRPARIEVAALWKEIASWQK